MEQTILTTTQQKALLIIAANLIVKKQFYLTGGTALSEYYLHHRLSEDLDFFSEQEVDKLWLTSFAKTIKSHIQATKVDMQQTFNRNLLFFTVGKELLKTEFTYFPFEQIEKPQRKNGLFIDSLIDIAVNKFFTIYQQPASRHFIDLYCILEIAPFHWENLSKLARNKFDIVIDPIQLGSQLLMAKTIGLLPNMIKTIKEEAWRNFYLQKAKELKDKISI
jgi:hypothetical protein